MFYKTQFNGYSVKFSPYNEGRIAVATAQNFGIIGNGRQYVLDVTPQGLREVAAFDTVDGLYDCTWCEANENVLASASGDGSVKVWDVAAPPHMNPIRSFEEHGHEVYCVNWNLVNRDCFLSASWDDTIKLWSLQVRPHPLPLRPTLSPSAPIGLATLTRSLPPQPSPGPGVHQNLC